MNRARPKAHTTNHAAGPGPFEGPPVAAPPQEEPPAATPPVEKPSVKETLTTLKTRLKNAGAESRYAVLLDLGAPWLYDALVRVHNAVAGAYLRVDACSVCQLRCQKCSTAKGINRKGVVGWGYLKADDFVRLMEDNPSVRTVELSNWGEIFLNPELVEIMRYACGRNIRLKAGNGVNLNTLTDETAEALVRYRFHYLSISIDGASHQTYKVYRRKGRFKDVIANIERINHYKQRHGTRFPKLAWQFVVFGHNEHELPAARQMAQDLDMTFKPKLNHSPAYSPVQDLDFVRQQSGLTVASRDEYASRTRRPYSFPCAQLWDSPQINWDGKLLGCCVNKYGHFGNVFELGLDRALRTERYTYAKKMVVGLLPPRADIPCVRCKVYQRIHSVSPAQNSSPPGLAL